MIKVDVRGLSCPEPVLITMDEMDANEGKEIVVLCDEAHTRKNIEIMLQHNGKKYEVNEIGSEFEITIKP